MRFAQRPVLRLIIIKISGLKALIYQTVLLKKVKLKFCFSFFGKAFL
jgi:hypothetical protein